MRRRDFIAGLGSTAAWPVVARAQQGDRVRRIAVMMLYAESDPEAVRRMKVFEQALEMLGWTGGRKLQIDYRWNVTTLGKGRDAVTELLKLSPEVIVCASTGQALVAAQAATRTIPIVFLGITEPIGQGFVQSLAHPGGNITGFAYLEPTLGAKWLELLKEIAPGIARVAVMFNPDGTGLFYLRYVEAAAQKFAVEVMMVPVHDPAEIASGIETFSRQQNGALIFPPDAFMSSYYKLAVELAARYRLPAIYQQRAFIDAGGLASYSVNTVEQYGPAASYVDRILRGEKPADLPVQQPTRFELIINLKTARALGLTIPETLLATADEVIQ
jgi:putative tryptophan/tyrosine transport system substrate-binding protein